MEDSEAARIGRAVVSLLDQSPGTSSNGHSFTASTSSASRTCNPPDIDRPGRTAGGDVERLATRLRFPSNPPDRPGGTAEADNSDVGRLGRSRGRDSDPRACISDILAYRSLGMSWSRIARELGTSRKTVYNRLAENHVTAEERERFTDVEDRTLDRTISDLRRSNPLIGEVMIRGHLRSQGISVPRRRIREALQRLDPAGGQARRRRIFRREYNVPAPNSLWYIDGNHKSIR